MAHAASDLDTLQFGQRKLHLCTTNDALSVAVADDYFLASYERFTVGDIILLSIDVDGTIGSETLVVSAVTSATVTTTNTSQ